MALTLPQQRCWADPIKAPCMLLKRCYVSLRACTNSRACLRCFPACACTFVFIMPCPSMFNVSPQTHAKARWTDRLIFKIHAQNAWSAGIYTSGNALYPSTSYLDDLMLAAGFLYWATKTPLYKADAEAWQSQLQSTNDPSITNLEPSYDNNYWAANVVMYRATGDKAYLQVRAASY